MRIQLRSTIFLPLTTPTFSKKGFTLIEMSIVLVIIGLLVGAVLVGQNLIAASEVSATISQIQKYQSAVHTFDAKYGYLPGDIPAAPAAKYGFIARGPCIGEGDGNGILQGTFSHAWCPTNNGSANSYYQAAGETAVFWVDLSTAGLIDGSFNTASNAGIYLSGQSGTNWYTGSITGSMINLYMPAAKLGRGNFIYTWSNGTADWMGGESANNKLNYFGLAQIIDLQSQYGDTSANANIPVSQAYAMDAKVDDGLPMTGTVRTQIASEGYIWVNGVYPGAPNQFAPSPTTCVDNNNVAGAVPQYSMTVNGGAGTNCALSFEFD